MQLAKTWGVQATKLPKLITPKRELCEQLKQRPDAGIWSMESYINCKQTIIYRWIWLHDKRRHCMHSNSDKRSKSYIELMIHASRLDPYGWATCPWFKIKISPNQCREYHCGDKTAGRSFYLHNGSSYIDKMVSLFWHPTPLVYIMGNVKCIGDIIYPFIS